MNNNSALVAARRRWWIIVLLAGLGAALGALPAPARVEEQAAARFVATHTMLLNNSDGSSGNSGVSPNQVAFFAVTGEVPKRAAAKIGYDGNPAFLASEVTVDFDSSVGALTVSTTQSSSTMAELVADTFAEELNTYLAERQDAYYEDRLAASTTRLTKLQKQLKDLSAQQSSTQPDPVLAAEIDAVSRQYSVSYEQNQALSEAPSTLAFTTLERAQAIPVVEDGGLTAPTSRSTRGILGLLVGAAIGLGITVLIGVFDRRIRTREQAEDLLGIRARVMIPAVDDAKRAGLAVVDGRHDALSDSYRTVRNVVSFVHEGLPPVKRARVTMVMSAGPGEGKTSLAANLAAAFAETGRLTIAVNCDFRRPRLTRHLNGSQSAYHPFSLSEIQHLDPRVLLWKTKNPTLSIFDLAHLGSPGELARSTASVVPDLGRISDSIIIDTSPVGATAEVLDLVPVADVIILVVRVGVTQAEAAERTIAIIRDLTTAPILLVLTGTKAESSTYYEYEDRRKFGPARSRWWLRGQSRQQYAGPERRGTNLSGGTTERVGSAADRRPGSRNDDKGSPDDRSAERRDRRADDTTDDPTDETERSNDLASLAIDKPIPRLPVDPGLRTERQSEPVE